jgi:hypothetical protein
MTDAEIIKALECCSTTETCDQCPLWSESCNNGSVLHKYSLDLINRQQAEIEDARNGVKSFKNKYENALDVVRDKQELIAQLENDKEKLAISYANAVGRNMTIKAESIKEFAERLKGKFAIFQYVSVVFYSKAISIIDNLVKEMVGE